MKTVYKGYATKVFIKNKGNKQASPEMEGRSFSIIYDDPQGGKRRDRSLDLTVPEQKNYNMLVLGLEALVSRLRCLRWGPNPTAQTRHLSETLSIRRPRASRARFGSIFLNVS